MAAVAGHQLQKQLSISSVDDFKDDSLDPRVQEELEILNRASDEINQYELELDAARASFRQVLTDSTQKLNALSKKLGTCIEKARPYYEARMKAKEAQIETQNAALRFERACSQLAAAKEMVFLAEQGFFKKGQPFDPAWQEMLNHATMKVHDSEVERIESEAEHQRTAHIFSDAEQRVKQIQRQMRRNINKSKPYFEMKARFNQQMEEQKNRVSWLEESVLKAKKTYSDALKNLEAISDEIHRQRRESKLRAEMGTRGSGVGAEAPSPPPDSDEDYTPDGDHVGFIDPLGVLKGSNKKSSLRSVSPENNLKKVDKDVCDNKVPTLPPECERSETEGKAASPNLSSQDLNDQKGNVDSAIETVQVKEELLPDPLNVTLIPSTATKPVPKLSPRKAVKTNENGNGPEVRYNNAQTASVTITPSLPIDTKLTQSCAENDKESSRIQSTVSSTTTAVVQPSIPKQVRPTSISASPPKVKNIEVTGDIKPRIHSKDIKSQRQKISHDNASLPVLTVQSLPQSNINMSRIVVSEAGDTGELAVAPAISLVTSTATSAAVEIQNHVDGTHNESTKLSEKDVSEGSVHTADLLSPISDKSASATPAYEVISPDVPVPDEEDIRKTNAEIMDRLQRAKGLKSPLSFLRPNRSSDDLLDEASDTGSMTGSIASVSVLDDDQIESLMMETGEYVTFLAQHSDFTNTSADAKSLPLPAKLSYLQEYMKFKPEWVDAELEVNPHKNGAVNDNSSPSDTDHVAEKLQQVNTSDDNVATITPTQAD